MATDAKLPGAKNPSHPAPLPRGEGRERREPGEGAPNFSSLAPLRIHGEGALWKTLCSIALRGMDRMLSLEPKIIRDKDPKCIHDFRVACRRLEQALDLLAPPPLIQPVRRLRRKVKRSRRAFSSVRNYDVLMKWSERHLGRKHAAYRPAWEALLGYLGERRPEAHARALRRLTKLNLAKAYLPLHDALQTSTLKREPASDEFAAPMEDGAFLRRISEELEAKWRRFENDLADSQRSPDGKSVHQARIAAKRLRYLIEIMREFEIAGCDEALDWLRGVQQRLGSWHDLHVMEQVMAEALARPQFLRSQFDAAWEMMKLMRQNRKAISRLQGEHTKLGLASEPGRRVASWVGERIDDFRFAVENHQAKTVDRGSDE